MGHHDQIIVCFSPGQYEFIVPCYRNPISKSFHGLIYHALLPEVIVNLVVDCQMLWLDQKI